jgi:hypothetical protein
VRVLRRARHVWHGPAVGDACCVGLLRGILVPAIIDDLKIAGLSIDPGRSIACGTTIDDAKLAEAVDRFATTTRNDRGE